MQRPSLDRVANICLIITCAIVGGRAISGTFRVASPSASSTYKQGDVIRDTPELGLSKAPLTLLMFTASTCHFCTASMPFYRRLTESARSRGTRVVAVAAEPPDVNRTYLQKHGVSFETVVSSQKSSMKIVATPTLVLVRTNGVVLGAWQGQLSDGAGERVMSAATRPEAMQR